MIKKTSVQISTRPATMIGRFLETMPGADERPIRDNAAVREEATRRMLGAVCAALPEIELDRLEAALQAATRWANDPHEIASKLSQRLKIEGGEQLLRALSGFPFEISVCHEMMVKAWVRTRNVKPAFAEGDDVIATLQDGMFKVRSVHGVISSVDEDTAVYVIKVRERGRLVSYQVEFENVVRRGSALNNETTSVMVDGADD